MIINATSIANEIDNAQKKLKRRRDDMRNIVDGMAGRASLQQDGSATRMIENHPHQYASLVVPRMVSGDPRVRVDTPRAGVAKLSALAGECFVNEWINQTRHRILAQRLATDCVLGWGMALLHLERQSAFDDDDDDPSAWPILTRLEQGDAFFDPAATSWQNKAFSGYQYGVDHKELIERSKSEDGWYRGAVRNMPSGGVDELDRPNEAPNRGEVVVREVHLPGFTLPEAPKFSNGTIFTLGVSGAGSTSFLRAPMPFFGPPWGPLYLYDVFYVPGQALGMSPCEAVQALVEEVNLHANALSRSTASRKRIAIASLLNRDDADEIRRTPEGGIALLAGVQAINEIVKEIQLGGGTNEQRQALAEVLDRLQRNSALDDAAAGNAQRGVTATAVATANASQGIRTGYVSQRFGDCDEEALRGVLWYVIHSRALKVHINPEEMGITPELLKTKGLDPDSIHEVEATIRGGPNAGLSFGDYSLNLDRYSMERVSEDLMQQRALQLADLTLKLATVAPQIAGFTDVRMILNQIGQAFNQRDFGNIIDPQKAAQMGGIQAMAQAQQPDAEYPGPQGTPGDRSGQRAYAGAAA